MLTVQHVTRTHCLVREYLFWLCAVWTVFQMAGILLEFLRLGALAVPHSMPLYNFILIAVYAGVKEGARWAQKRMGRKPGEYFFFGWWLYALALHVVSAFSHGRYAVPATLFANVWFVSVVYLASSFSKLANGMITMELRIRRMNGRSHVRGGSRR